MDIKQVFNLIKKDLEIIENSFEKYTVSNVKLAEKISRHILFSGGKRVRPSILILSAKMCGYTKPDLYPIACAIELLHTATLLHDDVVDSADKRRGKKSANALWGNKASVLVGDFVHSQVFGILVQTRSFELLDIFTKTTLNLANGEIFQLTKEFDTKITKDEYFQIVKNKTAILMAAAMITGGVLAQRSDTDKKALYSFGMELGMAFQIIDDALDYDSNEKELGKAMLADLKDGRITLPLIHILETGSRIDKAALKKIILSGEEAANQMKTVSELINKYDSVNYAKGIARQFHDKAVKQLKIFENSEEKSALLTIADFVIERKY